MTAYRTGNKETDTANGKTFGRQVGLWAFYIIGTIFLFKAIQLVLLKGVVEYALDIQTTERFEPWVMILTIYLIGHLLISFKKEFAVNPRGNHVIATNNIFSSKTLEDGGTLFTIYGTGFALKWPWERKLGVEIEIEREEIHDHDDFTVSCKAGASLIIKMSTAWRPAVEHLSTFLQSAGHNPLNPKVLLQIAAKAQQTFEQLAATYEDSEKLRASQSILLKAVMNELHDFATSLGIEVFDISLKRCDYDANGQKIRDKRAEGKILTELIADLWKEGEGGYATHADAVRAGSILLGLSNISDHQTGFTVKIDTGGVTPETADLLKKMDLDALALLIAEKLNTKKEK
jgi:hypothetical protein